MKATLIVIRDHIYNWLELYLWVPLFLFGILGAIKYAHFITGRPPASPESSDWIIEFADRLVACIFVIVLVSIVREQTSVWLTKEERMANVKFTAIQTASSCFFAALFTYILLH